MNYNRVSLSKGSYTSGLKGFDDYTRLEDLLSDINSIQNDNFYLAQSIEVVDHFLRKQWPQALGLSAPMQKFDKTATLESDYGKKSTDLYPNVLNKLMDVSLGSASLYGAKSASGKTMSLGSTPRQTVASSITNNINIVWKIILVDRNLEELGSSMAKLKKRFNSATFLLVAEEENFRLELEEIRKGNELFNQMLTEHMTGELVKKEKFQRYLESELENKDREWKRMRLNLNSLQVEYARTKSQQRVKLELRAQLNPIDIDKLLIQNEEKQYLLKKKTVELHNMKREVARKGSSIISDKLKLTNTISNLEKTVHETKTKQAKYEALEAIEEQTTNGLHVAERMFEDMKMLSDNVKAPDVQSYIELEIALGKLRKERDNLMKRCSQANHTTTLLHHQLRQLTPLAPTPDSTTPKKGTAVDE